MTEPIHFNEPGSDEQLTPEEMQEVRNKFDLDRAALVEEDRKTAATTPKDDPEP